jgi:hypothetical protein
MACHAFFPAIAAQASRISRSRKEKLGDRELTETRRFLRTHSFGVTTKRLLKRFTPGDFRLAGAAAKSKVV